jgi:hypothetical protein
MYGGTRSPMSEAASLRAVLASLTKAATFEQLCRAIQS